MYCEFINIYGYYCVNLWLVVLFIELCCYIFQFDEYFVERFCNKFCNNWYVMNVFEIIVLFL